VVQEALRNTLKHAKASRITIRLEVSDDRAYLRFQDNGQGFQVPSQLSSLTRQDHFGLVSMLEQVSWVGGDFAIQSQPHIGTKLTVSIPLLIQTSAREDLVESEEDHV
jgi:signal transduction histidine kinase